MRLSIAMLVLALSVSVLAAQSTAPSHSQQPLSSVYQKWLDEDVVYIIQDDERAAFLRLATDAERDRFIEQFWQRRDPTPDTPRNEFKEEHYRRVAYSNEHFAAGIPGWKTDRGRVYITFGPPDQVESHPGPPAYEYWKYRRLPDPVVFVDEQGDGSFRLTKRRR